MDAECRLLRHYNTTRFKFIFNIRVDAVFEMKVAYLPAFKFNLTSHGLKTSWLMKTDDHDKYQWRCNLMQYIVQNSQQEWPFATQDIKSHVEALRSSKHSMKLAKFKFKVTNLLSRRNYAL